MNAFPFILGAAALLPLYLTFPGHAGKDKRAPFLGRNIAHNMAFLIRSIAAQKEEKGLPVEEHGSFTSFPDGK